MPEIAIQPSQPANLIGQSPSFRAMLEDVSALAAVNRPVLIIGERGTGKELIANRIMFLSHRWNQSFITLNCGALSESVLDSELFGHEAGAFTGAARRRQSRFELADGGTMFLDEIGNAAAPVQEKLLRLIEYGKFERVGGNETISVDVRLIAATNADLRAQVQAGKFRADLLDRLAFDVILIPPLRAREGDILVLAQHFAERMTAELKRDFFAGFAPAAQRALQAHHWPGNVRELRNVVERAVYRLRDARKPLAEVTLDPFGPAPPQTSPVPSPTASPPPATFKDFRALVDEYEQNLLRGALEQARFNQKQAAGLLGLSYHQFRNALKKYRL